MVKINIKMPSGCHECPCLSPWFGESGLEYNCGILHKKLNSVNNRQDWCPLIDIDDKTCKNCQCSEPNYGYEGSFHCYYGDYEKRISPSVVGSDDFCSNWRK